MNSENPKPGSGKQENGNLDKDGAEVVKNGPFDYDANEETDREERLKGHSLGAYSQYNGAL